MGDDLIVQREGNKTMEERNKRKRNWLTPYCYWIDGWGIGPSTTPYTIFIFHFSFFSFLSFLLLSDYLSGLYYIVIVVYHVEYYLILKNTPIYISYYLDTEQKSWSIDSARKRQKVDSFLDFWASPIHDWPVHIKSNQLTTYSLFVRGGAVVEVTAFAPPLQPTPQSVPVQFFSVKWSCGSVSWDWFHGSTFHMIRRNQKEGMRNIT